ncbi:MAG: prepilin-type N-terminal cleavage/methylation domain-containing protein, partial [Armatimonadota bacterium]|nr:prepilin-type N-terminal cleavage/methylation domain-containing protein [Armatimonadota bacterium]
MSNSRGFSLIELIIVVAVIAILAAIMIPNFLGQRQRAA